MDSNNPGSQDVGGKAVADIKKDFIAVGKSHVHGWYAWAIVGIVVGMAWGIVYVSSWSNQQVTFDASNAAQQVTVTAPTEQTITFVSDGTEKVAVFIPDVKKYPGKDNWERTSDIITAIVLTEAGGSIGGALGFIGAEAGALAGSVIGAPTSFFTTIVVSSVESAVNAFISQFVALPIPSDPLVDRGYQVLNTADTAVSVVSLLKREAVKAVDPSVKVAVDAVKDEADRQTKRVQKNGSGSSKINLNFLPTSEDRIVKITSRDITRAQLDNCAQGKGCDNGVYPQVPPKGADSLLYIKYRALHDIRYSEDKYNPILAKDKIEKIKTYAIEQLKYVAGQLIGDHDQYSAREIIKNLDVIAYNTGNAMTATQAVYNQQNGSHYLEFDKVSGKATILPATAKPWEMTIPNSSWIGYRDNLDINGRGPEKYTTMFVAKKFNLPTVPSEAMLGFISTSAQVEVRVNGVAVYTVSPKKNKIVTPNEITLLDITKFIVAGDNRIGFYEVQAGGNNQRFGIDFAGYAKFAQ